MSSSRTAAVASVSSTGTSSRSSLLAALGSVPDPRDPRGVRHRLAMLLAVSVTAVLAGARSFAAIGEWVTEASEQVMAALGADGARPEESTIRRTLARVDADRLDQVLGAWMWTRTTVVDQRRVIAIDGKSLRGARARDPRSQQHAPHLVAAFDQHAGTVLGQVAVAATSNEIPAVRTLLAGLDLTGAVITVDAMHTQIDTAALIVAGGGHYVFTVKSNTPSLYAACKALPWARVPAHTSARIGHGRRTRRTIKTLTAPAWVGFPHAAQVAQIRRTVTRAGKKSVEVVYVITSADHHSAPPANLAAWVQGHWSIENQLHWVRDVTYQEDHSQVRTGNAPRVMATLRNTAISALRLTGASNIAARLRHHARHPQHAVTLLLTC